MYPACASTARPAIKTPSINWCGSFSISTRSLQVPGSLSSAFTTMYLGFGDVRGTKLHFIPVGNPAASAEVRRLDLFDNFFRLHLRSLEKCLIPFAREIRHAKPARQHLGLERT